MIPIVTGMATSANNTRRASSDIALDRDAAETPLATLEIQNRFVQVALAEIGPQHRRDVQLGVRDLPEQEVRESLLAGGANQQVGIGRVSGKQPLLDLPLIDVL